MQILDTDDSDRNFGARRLDEYGPSGRYQRLVVLDCGEKVPILQKEPLKMLTSIVRNGEIKALLLPLVVIHSSPIPVFVYRSIIGVHPSTAILQIEFAHFVAAH